MPNVAELLNANSKGYHYEFIGNPNSQTIAGFLAPALGRTQEVIKGRYLPRLEKMSQEWGICFAYPVYDNGQVIVEPGCGEGKDFFTPAISPETGRNQFLDFHRLHKAIKKEGAEAVLFPMMGGSGSENIIPLIDTHFRQYPDEIDASFKIFAFSNISNFAILAANDYCRYVSTPFSLIAASAETNPYCEYPAKQTELMLQGKVADVDPYARKILHDPALGESTKLHEINNSAISHYPLNRGVLDRRHQKSPQYAPIIHNWFPQQANWSFAFEGFLKECSTRDTFNVEVEGEILSFCKNYFKADHAATIHDFLQDAQARNNFPKLMELGIVAPSLAGESYFLAHDENGFLADNDYNIARLRGEKVADPIPTPNPISTIKGAILAKSQMDDVIASLGEENVQKLVALRNKIIQVPHALKEAIESDPDYKLTAEHASLIIQMERAAQLEMQNKLVEIAQKFEIPVLLNARFGHVAANNVVNGGLNYLSLGTDHEGAAIVTMRMPEQHERHIESQQNRQENRGLTDQITTPQSAVRPVISQNVNLEETRGFHK